MNYLPIFQFSGGPDAQLDAADVLNIATTGVGASALAARWNSPVLVDVNEHTLTALLDHPDLLEALEQIEDFRNLANMAQQVVTSTKKLKKAEREKGKDNLDDDEKKEKKESEQRQEADPREVAEVPRQDPRLHVRHRLPRRSPEGRHRVASTPTCSPASPA